MAITLSSRQRAKLYSVDAWNNGKSGAKLDLTSSTTPGLQMHKFDHTRTANPCDRLQCCRAALLLVGCPHSLVYLHLPVVEGLIFCVSGHPIWEPPSHYSLDIIFSVTDAPCVGGPAMLQSHLCAVSWYKTAVAGPGPHSRSPCTRW